MPGRLRPHPVRAGQPPLRRRARRAASFDQLVDRPPRRPLADDVPPHGTLVRVRRSVGLLADHDGGGRRARRRGRRRSARPRRPRAGPGGVGLMAVTDAPQIVTARLGYDDSHTLERYLATGGYDGLRKALTMTPEAVAAEVDAASLLGRGGAGFPAGRKWSMLRKNPVTYLVVNGDESEPATFKDHLLVERDPHQIIEGVLIAAYALQVTQAFIYLRGEFALGLERVQQALNEAYAHGAVGADIFGSGFSLDVVVHPGAGAYICGEETALLESLEGKRGFPRIKPPFFPAAIGLYGAADRRQQRRDHGQPAVDRHQRRGRLRRAGRGALDRHPAVRPVRPRAQPGHLRGRDGQDHLPRPHLRARCSAAGSRAAATSRPSSPAGCRRRGSAPTRSTSRSGQDEVGDAGSMLGSGSVVVMDSSHLRGAGRLAHHQVLRPRVLRPVHARAGRARAGSSGSCTGSSTGPAARRTSTC